MDDVTKRFCAFAGLVGFLFGAFIACRMMGIAPRDAVIAVLCFFGVILGVSFLASRGVA